MKFGNTMSRVGKKPIQIADKVELKKTLQKYLDETYTIEKTKKAIKDDVIVVISTLKHNL